MKVAYEDSLTYKALQRIESIQDNAILRQDLADLGSPRQVSRALNALIKLKKLIRLGYGIYGKLGQFKEKYFLEGGFVPTAREALDKLGVRWELSECEKDYNSGKSTQVPISPSTIVISNFSRKLQYDERNFRIKKESI